LRHSLERLQEESSPEEELRMVRDKTQRDRPVEGGFKLQQYEQIPEEEDNSIKTS